jgi:hypothetical protein
MLKCYDSVTDGSVSRWSFHTACIDPTAPANARCRKNVVVRSFVFFKEDRNRRRVEEADIGVVILGDRVTAFGADPPLLP